MTGALNKVTQAARPTVTEAGHSTTSSARDQNWTEKNGPGTSVPEMKGLISSITQVADKRGSRSRSVCQVISSIVLNALSDF